MFWPDGKDLHGWVQVSRDGDVWLSAVRMSSILVYVDTVSTELFGEDGLLGNRGLPDDIHRDRHESWVAKEFQFEHGFSHTWFDWGDLGKVLSGKPNELEASAYRSDPDFLNEVSRRRRFVSNALRDDVEDGEQWRLLLAVVEACRKT
jgi:hypothetical protein